MNISKAEYERLLACEGTAERRHEELLVERNRVGALRRALEDVVSVSRGMEPGSSRRTRDYANTAAMAPWPPMSFQRDGEPHTPTDAELHQAVVESLNERLRGSDSAKRAAIAVAQFALEHL